MQLGKGAIEKGMDSKLQTISAGQGVLSRVHVELIAEHMHDVWGRVGAPFNIVAFDWLGTYLEDQVIWSGVWRRVFAINGFG